MISGIITYIQCSSRIPHEACRVVHSKRIDKKKNTQDEDALSSNVHSVFHHPDFRLVENEQRPKQSTDYYHIIYISLLKFWTKIN